MNSRPVLPFGLLLDPDPDFGGGYTIREPDGFALVGKGVSYRDIDLRVEVLVGYGVRADALAAEVVDDAGKTQFIKVVKRAGDSGAPFLVDWAKPDVKVGGEYEWVDLSGKE